MSRPQVGIDRLPPRRTSEQPKEAMNCKSCRKRKIKCNRLRPSCEACQIFGCPCVYDAVPKKRGPKTDVLEALLKRVDGLEKRLRHDGDQTGDQPPVSEVKEAILEAVRNSSSPEGAQAQFEISKGESSTTSPPEMPHNARHNQSSTQSPSSSGASTFPSHEYATLLLDTYFSRIHGKPYHVLDEAHTRQRLMSNQLPSFLSYAIFSVSARYTASYASFEPVSNNAREYARQARADLDIDEPSIEGIQTMLLLSQAMFQEGVGKRAYMYLSSAITMALALNIHRELPATSHATPMERENRRRLFWSCYLMDRFAACGSKRPSLIADESILLRLPAADLDSVDMGYQAEYFSNDSNLRFMSGVGATGAGSYGMLIAIVRILGGTNRYLAAGGVKGDSHFPWHALSTLSKIRQELDVWSSDTQDVFSSLEGLFGRPDSVIFVMSKLIYHLIYCLIYRPFLPVDLIELETTSQHQSWQIEATNLCFLHANAITELVEIGKTSAIGDWPAFVSYCVCTAGTIHVHGAFYQGQIGDVYSMSCEFLTREVQQLSEFRYVWGGIQHQKDTLQMIYGAHSELVRSLASNPIRFSPVFQMEDFFDRYPGYSFDGSHITLNDQAGSDISRSSRNNSATELHSQRAQPTLHRSYSEQTAVQPTFTRPSMISRKSNPNRKRRSTASNLAHHTVSESNTLAHEGSSSTTSQQPYLVSPNLEQPHQFFTELPHHSAHRSSLSTPTDPSIQYTPPSSDFMHVDYSGLPNSLPQLTTIPSQNSSQFDPTTLVSGQFVQGNEFATPRTLFSQMGAHNANATYQNPTASPVIDQSQQEDMDPFLALLEQLAENEQSRGGPSELDFYLSGSGQMQ